LSWLQTRAAPQAGQTTVRGFLDSGLIKDQKVRLKLPAKSMPARFFDFHISSSYSRSYSAWPCWAVSPGPAHHPQSASELDGTIISGGTVGRCDLSGRSVTALAHRLARATTLSLMASPFSPGACRQGIPKPARHSSLTDGPAPACRRRRADAVRCHTPPADRRHRRPSRCAPATG